MWMDKSQRQSLEETGEHEETTSDPRNVGTGMKRKGSALLQSSSRLNGAQGSRCPHFVILGAMRKNGGICGATKAFLVYLTKGGRAKGKETLTKQQDEVQDLPYSISFMLHKQCILPILLMKKQWLPVT